MQRDTLRKFLSALIDDCGYDVVRKCLEGFNPALAGASASRDSSRKPRKKPNAVVTVESLTLRDEEKKNILMLLARKFEEKTFMPNVNHVRAFLDQEGEDISRIKSRHQVISSVFKHLAKWETQKLLELDTRGAYGGPKSFSVIAKSIENVGQQTRVLSF